MKVLVTGGTGSFGRLFVRTVLEQHQPKRLIAFSRDELKQFEMRQHLSAPYDPTTNWLPSGSFMIT